MNDTNINRQQSGAEVNELYLNMRSHYGGRNPKANGYRFKQYFLREQEMILSEIFNDNKIVVDLACGSGLMVQPLSKADRLVVGIDCNEIACRDAKTNKVKIIQGDIFTNPLQNSSVDWVINCGFLNTQPKDKAKSLMDEVYRILKSGGRLILVWRNDRALIHRLAVFIYRYIDKLTGRPEFAYYDNDIDELASYSRQIGFSVISKFLTFPLLRWNFHNLETIGAKTLGASCFLVVEK